MLSFGNGNAAGSLETKPRAARLWDVALKFFFPVLQITSPDHLVGIVEEAANQLNHNESNQLFGEMRKLAYLEKISQSREENQQTQPTYGDKDRIEIRPHWWKKELSLLHQLCALIKEAIFIKKCKNKFDCLVYEMLFIRLLKPNLNVQADSIRAKIFL